MATPRMFEELTEDITAGILLSSPLLPECMNTSIIHLNVYLSRVPQIPDITLRNYQVCDCISIQEVVPTGNMSPFMFYFLTPLGKKKAYIWRIFCVHHQTGLGKYAEENVR